MTLEKSCKSSTFILKKNKKKNHILHPPQKGSDIAFSCAYKHFNLIYKTKWPGRVQQTGMRGLIKENPGPVRHQSNLHVDRHFSANATFTVFNGDLNNSGSISIIQCLVVQLQDGFTRREGGAALDASIQRLLGAVTAVRRK